MKSVDKSKYGLKEFRCILIENEPLAIEMMTEYICAREELLLLRVIDNLEDCRKVLLDCNHIDVVFLDLKIRGGDVFQLIHECFNPSITFIITTAYPRRVINRLPAGCATYFISKPISIHDFNHCVHRFLADKKIL